MAEEPASDGLLTASENVNNENREKEMSSSSKENDSSEPPLAAASSDQSYYDNVTYTKAGVAVYTDPQTKVKYEFNTEANKWVERGEVEEEEEESESPPLENEFYFWSTEKGQWLLKANHTFDEKEKKWVPKEGAETTPEVEYGFEDGVRTYKDKDGTVFFWDEQKSAWFPKIDEDFMVHYQLNYGNYVEPPPKPEKKKPEKPREEQQEGPAAKKAKKMPAAPSWFNLDDKHNTKVYVENLPLDMKEEEFTELMAKYGMIFKDPGSGKFKIKLYRDQSGQLKGDGICTYIKVESVDLALYMLNGYEYRGHTLKVERAKFEMRGEYNPALKPKKKKKEKEKVRKLQEKLFDWRPDKMRGERSRNERIVVVKNLFEASVIDARPDLILEFQNDLREECSKCGTVRKVIIYDRHPEGVAQIIMGDPEEADIVVQLLNGRFFCQRKLSAYSWDGKEKFKVSETDAEMEARLSQWDKYLEEDNPPKEEEVAAAPSSKEGDNPPKEEDKEATLRPNDEKEAAPSPTEEPSEKLKVE